MVAALENRSFKRMFWHRWFITIIFRTLCLSCRDHFFGLQRYSTLKIALIECLKQNSWRKKYNLPLSPNWIGFSICRYKLLICFHTKTKARSKIVKQKRVENERLPFIFHISVIFMARKSCEDERTNDDVVLSDDVMGRIFSLYLTDQ